MKRITSCLVLCATLATSVSTPSFADESLNALRLFGTIIDQLDRGTFPALRQFRDDDDDGRFRNFRTDRYAVGDDDDDDGRRRSGSRVYRHILDDDDDDGRRRAEPRTYRHVVDDDDDDGRRHGQGRRWNDDDD